MTTSPPRAQLTATANAFAVACARMSAVANTTALSLSQYSAAISLRRGTAVDLRLTPVAAAVRLYSRHVATC